MPNKINVYLNHYNVNGIVTSTYGVEDVKAMFRDEALDYMVGAVATESMKKHVDHGLEVLAPILMTELARYENGMYIELCFNSDELVARVKVSQADSVLKLKPLEGVIASTVECSMVRLGEFNFAVQVGKKEA